VATALAAKPEWAPCATCDCENGTAQLPRWGIDGVLELTDVCPRSTVTPSSLAWLDLYGLYHAGHLALPGGALDQPAIYLEAMRVVQRWLPKFGDENSGAYTITQHDTEAALKQAFRNTKS